MDQVVATPCLAGKDAVRELGRIEVLPVQWRKNLVLPGDDVVPLLMPPGVRGLRDFISLR